MRKHESLNFYSGLFCLMIPFLVLWKLNWIVPPSISYTHYTNARDYFEVLLGLICFCFYFNPGFENKFEYYLNKISGFSGLGVILFPCNEISRTFLKIKFPILHYLSAGTLFISFSIILIFVFTQLRSKKGWTKNKYKRNYIYIFCGLSIIVSLILIATNAISIFYGEVLMILFYGIPYTLVQSKVFLKD